MRYKSWFALFVVFALLFAACGDSTDETTPDDGGTDVTAAPGTVTTIDIWIAFADGPRLNYTEERADEFNAAHPDYNVVVTAFDSYNTVFEQAQLALEGGNPPEIIHFFEAATQEALDTVDADGNPIFKSVTAAIGGRSEILGEPVILDDVVSAARNYYTVDGEFYSMPWNTSSAIMFVNQDILDAAGVAEIPKTWADVDAACEKIMALADAPKGCITWPNHSWFVEQSLGQEGVLLANNDNGRDGRATEVDLDSEGMVAYFEWWKSLDDLGYYIYTGVQRDWDGTNTAFQAQEVGMLIYSSSDTTVITETGTENGFNVVAAPMPYNGDVPYEGNLIGGATLWLRNGLDSVTEDGALAFMNFFSNPANAAEWHKITGYIPITEAAVQLLKDEGFYEESPNSLVASDQLAASADTPAARGALLGNFVAIRDVITAAAEDMLVNDIDPKQRLTEADAEAQQLLDEYNSLFGG
jgi:sn-glycerol 3-phosphate transport system substrate-binding protein